MQAGACPLCGGEAYARVIGRARDLIARRPGEFSVERCERCGLVATRPQPDAAALAAYYRDVYSGSGAALAQWAQAGPIGSRVARYRARVVLRHATVGSHSRVLDVGCGYGAFLAALDRPGGPSLSGIDTDAGCIAAAVSPDRIAYRVSTPEALAREQPGSFELVTLFETLEHMPDPVRALRAVHALLVPGGMCVVEVPDFDGAWRHVFGRWWLPLLVPQHLFHFTKRTLRETARSAGFEAIAAGSMFYPLESTASLGLWLNEKLGRPLRRFRPRWTRPDGYALAAFLAAWWLVVEVPLQALLFLLRRTGHQYLVARKPEPGVATGPDFGHARGAKETT
jgi:SAM-dependent methyltransferase